MSYVRFYSTANFTLATNGNTKLWNGTASNAMEYSTNGSTWSTWTGTSAINAGLSNGVYNLYLRGTGNTKVSNSTNTTTSTKFIFTGTQPIDSEGNIESLLDYATVDNNQHPTMNTYAFACLFYNQTLLRTPPELGSTTLTNYCYRNMFYGCTSLTIAPTLPATTLATYCYSYMFASCTSLTTSPQLPATTLAGGCYHYMFRGCTSLVIAPSILPATTLFFDCYYYMFYGCTSLVIAPTLPATTLAANCYFGMFENCASLIAAPELPATTLATSCYTEMFLGCTSLTIPPQLPATTLTDSCYVYMFYNTGIRLSTTQHDDYTLIYRIPTTGTGTVGTDSLYQMFYNSGVNTPSINTTYYIKGEEYKVTKSELSSIATAIREKTGNYIPLTYPNDFISELNNIQPGELTSFLSGSSLPANSLGVDGDFYTYTGS